MCSMEALSLRKQWGQGVVRRRLFSEVSVGVLGVYLFRRGFHSLCWT